MNIALCIFYWVNKHFRFRSDYKSLLPEEVFSGSGVVGPMVFMTDDCDEEYSALHNAFHSATLILCVFQVLQAAWRWLWDSKNRIAMKDRQHLFHAIKYMVYAKDATVFDAKYQAILRDQRITAYTPFMTYVTKVYDRRELRALCIRTNLLIRGNNTNKYCEAAVRVV